MHASRGKKISNTKNLATDNVSTSTKNVQSERLPHACTHGPIKSFKNTGFGKALSVANLSPLLRSIISSKQTALDGISARPIYDAVETTLMTSDIPSPAAWLP